MQVIIYEQNGQVAVCVSTGELPIKEVLAKDCPAGAIIVDDTTLPQGADSVFFDAWKLNGSTVTVDFPTAQAHKLRDFNAAAVQVAQKRQLNTLAGIENTSSDADFMAELTAGRTAIANAKTTTDLIAVSSPA